MYRYSCIDLTTLKYCYFIALWKQHLKQTKACRYHSEFTIKVFRMYVLYECMYIIHLEVAQSWLTMDVEYLYCSGSHGTVPCIHCAYQCLGLCVGNYIVFIQSSLLSIRRWLLYNDWPDTTTWISEVNCFRLSELH